MRTKLWILSLVLLLFEKTSYSQRFDAKKATLQKVFDNIVNAYGNVKAPPSLQLITKKNSAGYPASYISTPIPTVKVEEQVFDICSRMGNDSLNALAIILSHELAHYYNDHTWCSDYSYAIRNTELGKKLKSQNKGEQLRNETQADHNGIYYCCIAGYAPFGVYDKLIDRIYAVYKLPAAVSGYPSKSERKMVCSQAQEKIRQLYPVYDAGLLLLYLNYLQEAESCFDYLAKYFPSREIYNNLGIAKFLYALKLKPYDTLNFIYPVDIDPASRLFQNSTRSGDNEYDRYISMLKDAKKQFEKAISLDPSYISSYINLACVNDALGNFQMALGNIYEAEQLNSFLNNLKHIKAIVQYRSGNSDIAEAAFQGLAKHDSVAAFNYRLLTLAQSSKNDIIAIEKFKDNYAESLADKISTLKNCKTIPEITLKEKKSATKINDRLTIESKIADNYSQIRVDLSGKTIEGTVTNEHVSNMKIIASNIKVINPEYGCLIFAGSIVKSISYAVK